MIRRTQHDAAQPDEIPGQGERDDLSATLAQVFVATCPSRLQDEGPAGSLTFVRELSTSLDLDRVALEVRQKCGFLSIQLQNAT
jgi:hypothetical protein